MADPAVRVKGLKEWPPELKAAYENFPKELAKTHRVLAKEVAAEAVAFALGYGGVTGHFADEIYGTATARQASIAVHSKGNAAIWGALRREGWFDAHKYDGLPSNQPRWVGNSGWDAGTPGGPYGINDAIRRGMAHIQQRYVVLIDALTHRPFPD